MILFVFEGEEREPELYRTLEKLYFPRRNDNIICSFGNNIYDLYQQLLHLDDAGDIVALLKERLSRTNDTTLEGFRSTDFSEIYLFFDYDFQHSQLQLFEINRRVREMLQLFDEETDNGKLYINYPMVESIRYTKELPDNDYHNYIVSRDACRDFKHLASEFSHYCNLDYLVFSCNEIPSKERYLSVEENWQYLIQMNIGKAFYLVTGNMGLPPDKLAINQLAIFEAQLSRYVLPCQSVSVLNSFPIFIYEYFKTR